MSVEQIKVTGIGIVAGVVAPIQSAMTAPSLHNWRETVADCNLVIGLLAGLIGLAWWIRRLYLSFQDLNQREEES